MKPASVTLSGSKRIITALACATLVTLFLFFVDEGYYNFKWMANPRNWIPFFFYTAAIFAIQLLISEVVLVKCNARIKTIATISTAAGLMIAMLVVFSK